jgi:hypothetical protein
MAYVELLRVRTLFLWFAAMVIGLVALVTISTHGSGVHVQIGGANAGSSDLAARVGPIPADALLLVAGLLTVIFGSILGPSLNREWETLDLAWTQPVSRVRLALTYLSVDAGAIACAFALSLCCAFVPLAAIGFLGNVALEPDTLVVALVDLGSAFMWYALVQAASAWYAGRAGFVVGLSWAAFTVLLLVGTTQGFGPLFHDVVLALNCFNPLAYVSSLTIQQNETVTENAILPLTLGLRLLTVWVIGVAACAIAIAGWKRLEV